MPFSAKSVAYECSEPQMGYQDAEYQDLWAKLTTAKRHASGNTMRLCDHLHALVGELEDGLWLGLSGNNNLIAFSPLRFGLR